MTNASNENAPLEPPAEVLIVPMPYGGFVVMQSGQQIAAVSTASELCELLERALAEHDYKPPLAREPVEAMPNVVRFDERRAAGGLGSMLSRLVTRRG